MDLMLNQNGYSKRSIDWDWKSGVRSGTCTYDLALDNPDNTDQSWHLPNYSALLSHPELCDLDAEAVDFVHGTQLLEFVTKQTMFEVDCVNYVASRIAHDKYRFVLPENVKLDALKIYTDEGYHAFYTQKLAYQIRDFYKIGSDDITSRVAPFYEKIERICTKAGEKYRDLSMLGLVIVGECQIVADISEEMKQVVYEPIRVMFRDHMADEVFHGKFFALVLDLTWHQLTPSERTILAESMCAAMILLGKPRTDIYYFSLEKYGFKSHEIDRFIAEIYDTPEWNILRIRDRVQPTLNLMNEIGIFEDEKIQTIFVSAGLLEVEKE